MRPGRLTVMTLATALMLAGAAVNADRVPPLSAELAGSVFSYTVVKGDSLRIVGSRFGVEPLVLARENALAADARLKIGQRLAIDNRHIVPASGVTPIVVNIPQRMVFFRAPDEIHGFPAGVGRPTWETPAGEFRIVEKRMNPTWYVPPSIQEEMRRSGKAVITKMPPSPENPLGDRWLGLSLDSVGIHGTIAPASVFTFQTHGCIRLHPDDVLELFERVELQTQGQIIYEPVLIAVVHGRVFVEVHRDVYRRGIDPSRVLADTIAAHYLAVDWHEVATAVQRRDGVARDVTAADAWPPKEN